MLKIAESYILIQEIENGTFMTWILYYTRFSEMVQSSVQIYVLIREIDGNVEISFLNSLCCWLRGPSCTICICNAPRVKTAFKTAFFMLLTYRHIVTTRYTSTERCAGVPLKDASLSSQYLSKTKMKRYHFGTLLKHSQSRFALIIVK